MDRKVIEAPPVTFRIRYSDVDRMGFLYHVNYLEYFEVGRSEWIRWFWKPYIEIEDAGFALVVIEASLRFVTPGKYDDFIEVAVRATDWGRSRIVFEYAITRPADNALLCDGRTAHCFINKTGKPIKMPDGLREQFQSYLHSINCGSQNNSTL